jgi:hypothetical protein
MTSSEMDLRQYGAEIFFEEKAAPPFVPPPFFSSASPGLSVGLGPRGDADKPGTPPPPLGGAAAGRRGGRRGGNAPAPSDFFSFQGASRWG